MSEDHRTLPTIHDAVQSATDRHCLICGGQGWVCENHPERPWAGVSTAANACECGPGMPCACTGLQGPS